MGDWFSGLWDDVSSVAGDVWSGVSSTASDVWGDLTDLFSDSLPDFETMDFPDIQLPEFGWGADGVDPSPQAGPADIDLGGSVNGNGMQQVGWPAAAGAAVVTLGAWLSRGANVAGAIFRGANGVTVKMGQLWPYVKKYGPMAVATGLGISAAQLAQLLEQAPRSGRGVGRRGRGISARDVKTTRRTLKQIKKLYHMMPTRRAAYAYGGGGYRRRRYR